MQNALNVEQARRRGLVVRRRDGLFSDWSSIIHVYRRTETSHLGLLPILILNKAVNRVVP
jgi:hypothetical protein